MTEDKLNDILELKKNIKKYSDIIKQIDMNPNLYINFENSNIAMSIPQHFEVVNSAVRLKIRDAFYTEREVLQILFREF